ncbi:MAG: SBBP repeat-containing protein [Dokdonella sp.]
MMSFKRFLAGFVTLTALAFGSANASSPPSHGSIPNLPPWVASYFGGNGIGNSERINGMVVDPDTQDIIVVGETNSANAPITIGAADTFFSGGSEGFVARFSADLRTLLAATYFGGNGQDTAYGVALDPSTGDVFIVGYSNSATLPGIAGAAQSIPGGGFDAFVARLSPNLDQIRQATFFGRLGTEYGVGIKIRETDRSIFIVGSSSSLTLPASEAGAQPTSGGGNQDGFIACFSTDLRSLAASTFQGGNGIDDLFGMWIDPVTDDVVVAGGTTSTNLGNLAGAAQSQLAGGYDVQLARFSGNLDLRRRSSYYGGSGNESPNSLEFDPITSGLLVAGATRSPALPGAAGTVQDELHGELDGFLVRFATDLGARGRATYVGGDFGDVVYGVVVNRQGDIFMTGSTQSTDFPGAPPLVGTSAFITRIPNSMLGNFSSLRWGSNGEVGLGTQSLTIAHSGLSRVCIGGITSGPYVPYTSGSARPNYGGGNSDGFITCVKDDQFPIFVDGFD